MRRADYGGADVLHGKTPLFQHRKAFMTPQEKELLTTLLDRVKNAPRQDKDPEADALIRQAMAAQPDLPYYLTQTVQILDQHGLRQVIGQIRLGGHRLTDQSVGLGILVLPRRIFHAVEQRRKKLFFLGGHECLPMLEKRCLPMKNISSADPSARRAKCGERGRAINNPLQSPAPPIARNFSRRCTRNVLPSMARRGANASSSASPRSSTASLGARCAPPSGSATIRSTTLRRCRS